MVSSIEQQNFPDPAAPSSVFADDTSIIAKPASPYYEDGVDVNYTAPAKWWNWLWNHISAWFRDSKSDRTSVFNEAQNVLSAASITPQNTNTHQLSEAIDEICYDTMETYDQKEMNGHKVNQPYVLGSTLYLPDTELL